MQAAEIMTKNVDTVNVGDKVPKAAVLMKKRDIGAVPVEDAGKIVGMITDRDITVRCLGDGREPDDTMVSDVMTPAVVSCRPDQDIAEVVRLMESKEVRRVLVLDETGKAMGIISLGDLAVKGQLSLACAALGKVSAVR